MQKQVGRGRPRKGKEPNRIREIRIKVNVEEGGAKIGLKELAEGSETSVSFINKLERGLVNASPEVKARIARYLDKPVEEVFSSGKPKQPAESS